jgi:hypothetical protein
MTAPDESGDTGVAEVPEPIGWTKPRSRAGWRHVSKAFAVLCTGNLDSDVVVMKAAKDRI